MADDNANPPKPPDAGPTPEPEAKPEQPPTARLAQEMAQSAQPSAAKGPARPIPADQILDASSTPPESGRALVKAGLVVSIIGFVIGWIPFLGYVGLIGAILAAVGRSSYHKEGNGKTIAAIVLGLLGTAGAIFWTVVAATASCPHVYAWDGKAWRLDADMFSGALFEGAEADDVDRMEFLAPDGDRYRLRVANERQEKDVVDRVALEVVDHAPGTTALPTQDGALVIVDALVAPLAAKDARGVDQLAAIRDEGAQGWKGEPGVDQHTRDGLEVTLPAPQRKAYLVLEAHNTEEGTAALYRYLAEIGPGVGPLLRLAQTDSRYPYRQRLADEMDRMGVPLQIELVTASGTQHVARLRPIGPAVPRWIAVELPATTGAQTTVRLTGVPGAWQIDRVAIAGVSPAASAARTLELTSARDESGTDLTALLASADGRRVVIEQGHHVELAFAAPARDPQLTRSAFLRMRGYYEVKIGGRGFFNPVALARHHLVADAAPRYFLSTQAERK